MTGPLVGMLLATKHEIHRPGASKVGSVWSPKQVVFRHLLPAATWKQCFLILLPSRYHAKLGQPLEGSPLVFTRTRVSPNQPVEPMSRTLVGSSTCPGCLCEVWVPESSNRTRKGQSRDVQAVIQPMRLKKSRTVGTPN